MTRAGLLLVLVATAACGRLGAAQDAYREGRFKEAHAAFKEAAEVAGDGAPAVLLYDRALAALRAGDHRDAETSAKKAASRAEGDLAPLCEFLLGNVAFARCEIAQAQANAVESEPFAFDVALGQARAARDAWIRAAATRDDWREARRNVERALAKIDELQRQKAKAQDKTKKAGKSDPRLRPQPVPTKEKPKDEKPPETTAQKPSKDDPGKDAGGEPQIAELTREEVLALFEKLAAKEKEKLALRRAKRDEPRGDVEKDW